MFSMYRLVMHKIYPESTLRLELEAVGIKYFVGEISSILLSQNFADWAQKQTRGSMYD